MMDQRAFISGITLGLLAAPLAAEAQPAGKPYRVGYVWIGAPGSESNAVDGLRQGLKELGYVEGQNIVIEYRYADGKLEALPGLLAEPEQIGVTDAYITMLESGKRNSSLDILKKLAKALSVSVTELLG